MTCHNQNEKIHTPLPSEEKAARKRRKPRGMPLAKTVISEAVLEKFWNLVDKRGPDECWPWKGHLYPDGKGRIWFNYNTYHADGFSHFLAYGKTNATALRTTCGNRACVNPAHLAPGSRGRPGGTGYHHSGCVGHKRTPLYKRWRSMIGRCYTKSSKGFHRYGGRGITVCDEWRHNFVAFREWAEASGFSPELQLDRTDNSKGYSPSNCRWVTQQENIENRDKLLRFPSGRTVRQLCEATGASRHTIRKRIKCGLPLAYIEAKALQKQGRIFVDPAPAPQ